MSTIRRILLVVYNGFELIDLSGPMSVFSAANDRLDKPKYKLIVASPNGGLVASGAGLQVATAQLSGTRLLANDTVLVTGGGTKALQKAMQDHLILDTMRRAANRVERYGSICSGAFILAAAGLLEGKRCTTHWAGSAQLSRYCPDALVNDDALHVNDGSLWTSAGASAGIDMALSMLEQDNGLDAMGHVAKWLVVYARRPGYQSQFSNVLQSQTATEGVFSPVADWMRERLEHPIRVSDMARQVAMSERTFYRRFTQAIGVSPSKYLETLRLDRAKVLLESGEAVKVVAANVGFQSHAAFRTAFKARFGTTPSLHARMFRSRE